MTSPSTSFTDLFITWFSSLKMRSWAIFEVNQLISSGVSASSIPTKINNPVPILATFSLSIVTEASDTLCITAFIIRRLDFYRCHTHLFDSFRLHHLKSVCNFYSATRRFHRFLTHLSPHNSALLCASNC